VNRLGSRLIEQSVRLAGVNAQVGALNDAEVQPVPVSGGTFLLNRMTGSFNYLEADDYVTDPTGQGVGLGNLIGSTGAQGFATGQNAYILRGGWFATVSLVGQQTVAQAAKLVGLLSKFAGAYVEDLEKLASDPDPKVRAALVAGASRAPYADDAATAAVEKYEEIGGSNARVIEIKGVLALGPGGDWPVPIVRTEAGRGEGVGELAEKLDQHRAFIESEGTLSERRRRNLMNEVLAIATFRMRRQLEASIHEDAGVRRLLDRVVARELDPASAATTILERPREA